MEAQDAAAALNRLPGAAENRDWFRAMREHQVPPELIGRSGTVKSVVYEHVKGPVHPYLRFEPGPIGGS